MATYELRLTQEEFSNLIKLDREARLFRPVGEADFGPFQAFVEGIIKEDGGPAPLEGSELRLTVVNPPHIIKEIRRLKKVEE